MPGGRDYHLSTDHYSFTVGRTEIETTVTNDPRIIANWVREVRSREYGYRGLVVGLDCEWKPNHTRGGQNPVATLQLCVGTRCLVVQLLYLGGSRYLREFLEGTDTTFVGVDLESDVEKLWEDHGLNVGGTRYDLGELAAERFGSNEYRRMGLQTLASEILNLNIPKERRITMSDWSQMVLSCAQVQYAVSDAYASFALGMILLRRRWRC